MRKSTEHRNQVYSGSLRGIETLNFFHNLVNEKRKRLAINKIGKRDGGCTEGREDVAAEAINFFQNQFTAETQNLGLSMLKEIPIRVTDVDNEMLNVMLIEEEIKKVVFELNGDSASGPDRFRGKFYQSCWNIVGADIIEMVKSFMEGSTLPKSITHTNLILLPKKENIPIFFKIN